MTVDQLLEKFRTKFGKEFPELGYMFCIYEDEVTSTLCRVSMLTNLDDDEIDHVAQQVTAMRGTPEVGQGSARRLN